MTKKSIGIGGSGLIDAVGRRASWGVDMTKAIPKIQRGVNAEVCRAKALGVPKAELVAMIERSLLAVYGADAKENAEGESAATAAGGNDD